MDPRYKFIRGKPFQGLSDYEEAKSIRTKKQKLIYHIPNSFQNSLFPEGAPENPAYGLRQRLGHYYELISEAISGGFVKKLHNLESNAEGGISKTEPDITNYKKNNQVLLKEVKAVAPGQALKLFDAQISKYIELKTGNYFSNAPSIRFDIFRHGISKIQKKYMKHSLEKLITDLSKTTKYMISLPFSVIFEICKADKKFTNRHDAMTYSPLTRFNSAGLNELIANPEYTLDKMNLPLDNLIIEKRKFPKTVKINENAIEPFPILLIIDNHSPKEISEKIKKDLKENSFFGTRFYFVPDILEESFEKDEFFSEGEIPF